MAYIGRDIEYGSFTKQTLTADSSTTVFALDQSVFDANSLLVSVGGVIQEPDEAYTASGTVLTFSEAPTTGDPIWIVYLGKTLGTSTTRGAITYQAATGDGSATTVAMTSSGNTGNIVVTLNGVVQTPSTDFSVAGSTLTFTTAPFNGAAIGIHYLGKQARLGVPSSGSIVQADLANSGTLPAWDGSALTGIAGVTKEDVFELQNNIALLNFLRANDITAKRTSMLNGFQDQFRTEDGIVPFNGVLAVPNSCLFDSSQSHRMTKSSFQPTSPYTISFWMKRGDIGRTQYVYRIGSADNFGFNTNNTISVERRSQSLTTTATFTSTTDWVHYVIKSEASQFTLYADNNIVGTNSSAANPDSAGTFYIGGLSSGGNLQGHLAEFHYVQGLALDPSNFGVANGGNWKPKAYTGSYGTTGFYLDFETANSLGQDKSGQGNNFSLSNLDSSDQTTVTPQATAIANTGSSELTYSNNTYTNSEELIDSYSNTNTSAGQHNSIGVAAAPGSLQGKGQAITLSATTTVSSISFHMHKVNSPTGNVYAAIYSKASGTVGTDAIPTNDMITLSNPVDASTITSTTSGELYNFSFSSPTTLTAGDYCIACETFENVGDASSYLLIHKDDTSPTHSGNAVNHFETTGNWTAVSSEDVIFYLYGTKNLEIMTKGTNDLSEVSSPSSAPSKGHIEALIDDASVGGTSIFSSNLDSDSIGDTGASYRQKVTPTGSGNRVRFKFDGATTKPSKYDNISIGKAVGSSYVTENIPVSILFGGQQSCIVPRSGSLWSDWLDMDIDASQLYLLTFDVTSDTSFNDSRRSTTSGEGYIGDWSANNYNLTTFPEIQGTAQQSLGTYAISGMEVETKPTINTDVIGELSRDGGTTWSPATLRRVDKVIAGSNYDVLMGDIDFTGDPSGTNIKGRIKTVNKHKVTVKGMAVNWQ